MTVLSSAEYTHITGVKEFDKSLLGLKNETVRVAASNYYADSDKASVQLLFDSGTRLRADYWRVTKDGSARISSFDHEQKYGLPAPIDAVAELKSHLEDKTVIDVRLDKETGDLFFRFSDGINFQVFSFTSYEAWEIQFPDGSGEYSNFAK
jgi:hypothetical protein